jgi:hypothetical protein
MLKASVSVDFAPCDGRSPTDSYRMTERYDNLVYSLLKAIQDINDVLLV